MFKCLALTIAFVAVISVQSQEVPAQQQEQFRQQAATDQAAAQQAAALQAAAQQAAAQHAAGQQTVERNTEQQAMQKLAEQQAAQQAAVRQQQMNAQQNEQIVVNSAGGGGHINMMRNKAIIQDRDHVRLHLDGVIDNKNEEDMSEKELQLHYFKLHDYDNNLKLDGLEMLKAMSHFHHDGSKDAPPLNDEELMGLIDPILREDDKNNDGYVDYPEFAANQA